MDNAHKLKSNWKRMVEDAPNVNIANQTAPAYIPKNSNEAMRLQQEIDKLKQQIAEAMKKVQPLNIKLQDLELKQAKLQGK